MTGDEFDGFPAEAASGFSPRGDGTVGCRRCNDTKYVTYDGKGLLDETVMMVAPCPECQIERYRWWRTGHLDPTHNPARCDHPICVAKAGKKGA